MSEVKMLFYPNTAKMNPNTRLIPVYTRIWKRSQKVEVKLDIYLHETDLGSWDIFTQRLTSANNEVNRKLEDIAFDFRGLKYIHKSDYEKFSPSEIKSRLFVRQGDLTKDKVFKYLENHLENYILPNSNLSQVEIMHKVSS